MAMPMLPWLVLLLLAGHGEEPAPKPAPKPKPGPGPSPGPAPSPGPSPAPAAQRQAALTPVAWPQAVPKDLPPFPSGWEADVPVPSEVQNRAWQLLPQLWKSGKPGAHVIEKTGTRWVAYQAFVPAKGKRGVAAFRPKAGYVATQAA